MLQILLLYSLCLKGDHRVPRGFQDIVWKQDWLGQDCQVVKGCRGVSRKFQETFLRIDPPWGTLKTHFWEKLKMVQWSLIYTPVEKSLAVKFLKLFGNLKHPTVGHVEVIPPQSSGHVIDPATKYGVRIVVDLAWRQLLSPHFRAHRAGYVPVGVLSDLLSKPGPPCRVNICSSIT